MEEKGTTGSLDFFESDLSEFAETHKYAFDVVLNLGVSVGYSSAKSENKKVLFHLGQLLKKNGFLVLQVLNRDLCVESFPTSFWRENSDYFILDRRELQFQNSVLKSTKVFIEKTNGQVRRYEDSVYLYSIEELISELEQIGLGYLKNFSTLSYESPSQGSPSEKTFTPTLVFQKK